MLTGSIKALSDLVLNRRVTERLGTTQRDLNGRMLAHLVRVVGHAER